MLSSSCLSLFSRVSNVGLEPTAGWAVFTTWVNLEMSALIKNDLFFLLIASSSNNIVVVKKFKAIGAQ